MDSHVFNIPVTAGLFSQLAGVLAGFAIAAIVLILTIRLTPAPRDAYRSSLGKSFAPATRLLVTSFLGLLLSSVNYAVLAGDMPDSARSAALEQLSGLGFATSGSLLSYAIALLFDGVNHAAKKNNGDSKDLVSVARFLRLILATVVTPILLMLTYLSTHDFKVATGRPQFDAIDIVAWSLILLEAATGALYYRFKAKSERRTAWGRRQAPIKRAATIGLTLSFAATGGLILLYAAPDDSSTSLSIAVPILLFIIAFLASAGFVAHLANTQS